MHIFCFLSKSPPRTMSDVPAQTFINAAHYFDYRAAKNYATSFLKSRIKSRSVSNPPTETNESKAAFYFGSEDLSLDIGNAVRLSSVNGPPPHLRDLFRATNNFITPTLTNAGRLTSCHRAMVGLSNTRRMYGFGIQMLIVTRSRV